MSNTSIDSSEVIEAFDDLLSFPKSRNEQEAVLSELKKQRDRLDRKIFRLEERIRPTIRKWD